MTPRVRLYACIAAANHGTSIKRVMGESRTRADVEARWEIMRRLHDDGFSLSQIGRWIKRDHSTVIHGLRRSGFGPRSEDSEARPSQQQRNI